MKTEYDKLMDYSYHYAILKGHKPASAKFAAVIAVWDTQLYYHPRKNYDDDAIRRK